MLCVCITLREAVDTGVRSMKIERGDVHEGIAFRRREATGGVLGSMVDRAGS